MKSLLKFITITSLAATALTACSDSAGQGEDPNPLPENAMVFINVDIALLADSGSTRAVENVSESTAEAHNSWTDGDDSSSDGIEPGTDTENTIHRALIIIRGEGKNLYAAVERTRSDATDGADRPGISGSGSSYTLTARIPMKKALEFAPKSGEKLEIYVVANYLGETYSKLITDDYDVENFTSTVDGFDSPYLSVSGGLPMSNFKSYSITAVADWDADFFAEHLTAEKAILLSDHGKALQLERSVARIDYRDRKRAGEEDVPQTPHTYRLGKSGYEVQVVSMCPVNVSRGFHTFRHILEADGSTLSFLGTEKSDNYFLDTDNGYKSGDGSVTAPGHFINEGAFSSGHGSVEPLWNGTTAKYPFAEADEAAGKSGYTPWRYLTENTIADKTKQLRGYTTAVMFRTKLTAVPDGGSEEAKALKAAFEKGTDPITVNVNGSSRELTPENGSYYLDYYHFIRHNDNRNPTEMGPMEFGVVRNNIYRLSIESINGLPTPYNPGDPDEPGEVDITLKARVKKWAYDRIIFDI